jgi:RNA-directed DNA polymerase
MTASRKILRINTRANTLFTFENLYRAYIEARKGKRSTINVLRFEVNLEQNMFSLLEDLRAGRYIPSKSVCFVVTKPVIREVFAADFRDRIVHHLYVRALEPFFEPRLDYDSYACRRGKGTLRASDRVLSHIRKVTMNRNRE